LRAWWASSELAVFTASRTLLTRVLTLERKARLRALRLSFCLMRFHEDG